MENIILAVHIICSIILFLGLFAVWASDSKNDRLFSIVAILLSLFGLIITACFLKEKGLLIHYLLFIIVYLIAMVLIMDKEKHLLRAVYVIIASILAAVFLYASYHFRILEFCILTIVLLLTVLECIFRGGWNLFHYIILVSISQNWNGVQNLDWKMLSFYFFGTIIFWYLENFVRYLFADEPDYYYINPIFLAIPVVLLVAYFLSGGTLLMILAVIVLVFLTMIADSFFNMAPILYFFILPILTII